MADNEDPMLPWYGRSWEDWFSTLPDSEKPDPISDRIESLPRPQSDCMRLPYEDMGLFGHCPERDPFYTVVCEQCKALVKPQGLWNHIQIWHNAKVVETLSPPRPPDKIVKIGNSSKFGAGNKSGAGNVKLKRKKPAVGNSHSTKSSQQKHDQPVSSEKAPEDSNSGITLQPIVSLTPINSSPKSVPSTGSHYVPSVLPVQLSVVCSDQGTLSSPMPIKRKIKSERKNLTVREYDPNKHCGVWIPETKKPCTRSLTCKSHALSMRRSVVGRSKNFDKLLADHRSAKEASGKLTKSGKTQAIIQVKESSQAKSPLTIHTENNFIIKDAKSSSCYGLLEAAGISSLPGQHLNSLLSPLSNINTCSEETKAISKYPVIATVTRINTSKLPPRTGGENLFSCPQKVDDGQWIGTATPKPIAVMSLTGRKQGAVRFPGRRPDQSRQGLQTALTQGIIRLPLANDLYSIQLNAATNKASSTMKTVLTNISSKGGLLGTSKLFFNSSKSHVPILPNTAKKGNNSSNFGSYKTVLPKMPQLSSKNQHTKSLVKNNQFHIPNILSASLKRPVETYKSNVDSKRKRKNNVNATEVVNSLLTRKPNSNISGNLQIAKVTLPVSTGNANCHPNDVIDTKSVFTAHGISDSTLTDVSKASIKAVTQNVRIAAAPSTVQVPASPITYLATTGPVTFQQIPVLSPQGPAIPSSLLR